MRKCAETLRVPLVCRSCMSVTFSCMNFSTLLSKSFHWPVYEILRVQTFPPIQYFLTRIHSYLLGNCTVVKIASILHFCPFSHIYFPWALRAQAPVNCPWYVGQIYNGGKWSLENKSGRPFRFACMVGQLFSHRDHRCIVGLFAHTHVITYSGFSCMWS